MDSVPRCGAHHTTGDRSIQHADAERGEPVAECFGATRRHGARRDDGLALGEAVEPAVVSEQNSLGLVGIDHHHEQNVACFCCGMRAFGYRAA